MANILKAKRPARPSSTASKKRKLNNGKQTASRFKQVKAADRGVIPIPDTKDDDDEQLSDQDIALFTEFKHAANFLNNLDHKGLLQSKKEMQRLHKLSKPVCKPKVYDGDDLPSLHSDDDEEDDDRSSPVDLNSDASDDENNTSSDSVTNISDMSNLEMPYEILPRKHYSEKEVCERETKSLPIKLANGKIKDTGVKIVTHVSTDEENGSDCSEAVDEVEPIEDVSTGARFGRPAVVDILQTNSRKRKIELAKEQIAGICQEIIADPENSVGLLRRLHTFALPTVTTTTHRDPVPNDVIIRQLAMLSQVAVYKDIIPGYRIRALTESEKAEKVSQLVARTRDWEQSLVNGYQTYLQLLEGELKAKTELAEIALRCMCKLLVEATHFNFRTNLMTCIVSYLSKKSWDKTSEMCSQSLITVFRQDLSGVPSLEIVRLLNRMIKERHFKIHPNVLSCLLHLRLRTELGIRASDKSADKPEIKVAKHAKGSKPSKVYLSKRAKKALEEQKEINRELREAEAEVDKEEKKSTQTETLKLLFGLYFRILKTPTSTTLLPSALSGIAKFAHLINIDFFSDVMKILKDIISRKEMDVASSEHLDYIPAENASESTLMKLMCIVTAFELLTGQGEALNIDLSEFVLSLYTLLMPMTLSNDIDMLSSSGNSSFVENTTTIDLLFRALSLIFLPCAVGTGYIAGSTGGVPWRAAAFAKRLLSASLHWTSSADVLRAIDFVKTLVANDPKLEAMLSTEDRIVNGVYRPNVDDPQLCQPFDTLFWELHVLHKRHWDPRIREQAEKLINFTSQ